jgi:uncharacterized protein
MKNRLNQCVQAYLGHHQVATLATHNGDDLWAAAVFYVNEGFNLYFLSAPTSRHCLNLTHNARVAVTIQEDYADWPDIKGVQLEGVAHVLSGAEERKARKLYGEKFPVVGKLSLAPAAIIKALAKVRWYKVVPNRLYFIDNSVGMGHRDEIMLD